MSEPLPGFEKPPLVEVALAVQFDKLPTLRAPQLGYVWQAFRDRFSKTEEQPPLEPVFEQFGLPPGSRPGIRFEFSVLPSTPRLWFLNDSGTELVQIQQDRFVRNWRKREDEDEYPRYDHLRQSFCADFQTFCDLVEREKWGRIEPNQCEVTYVNLIPAGEGWQTHGQLGNVVTVFVSRYSNADLGEPEDAAVNVRYVLKDDGGNPVGRLYVSATPAYRASDACPIIRLALTARGQPEGTGIDGVLRFLDRGREAIVRGFASITTPEMHRIWNRIG